MPQKKKKLILLLKLGNLTMNLREDMYKRSKKLKLKKKKVKSLPKLNEKVKVEF